MDKGLISIIVLSYKNLLYLEETIESILNQSYENIELIIGDDGTEDFKESEYREYINKVNNGNIKNIIIYKNLENLGTVKNLNKAIKLSNGDYIKVIGSDDVFYSNTVIEDMIRYIDEIGGMVLTTNILWCDKNMQKNEIAESMLELYRNELPIFSDTMKSLDKICIQNNIPAPGCLFKKDVFDKYGLFNEDYRLLEDWPKWIQLCEYKEPIYYLDIISVKYRIGSGVSTSNHSMSHILKNDMLKLYNNKILNKKYKIKYKNYRHIKYIYNRIFNFENYSCIQKIVFFISYIDILFIKLFKLIWRKR